MLNILEQILKVVCILLPLLITVAYFTLLERKVMASLQRRYGPNVIGFWGLLQPIADGLKLLMKEIIIPARANFFLFIFAPVLTMSLSFTLWSIVPLGYGVSYFDSNYGLLLLLTLSSLNVYSLVIAGWSSNSKYALLGALRAIAQLLSYELVLGIIIIIVVIYTGTLNLSGIVFYQEYISGYLVFPLLPIAGITFVVFLAETNRTPFDLPEAEAELVAGYNIEYSSIPFALFFLGEYCNIITMSGVWTILFFGGWWLPLFQFFFSPFFIFGTKIVISCTLFIMIRALLPRYRFDQLMHVGWKIFVPISFSFLIFLFGLVKFFDTSLLHLTTQYPIYLRFSSYPQSYNEATYRLMDYRDTVLGLAKYDVTKEYYFAHKEHLKQLFLDGRKVGAFIGAGNWAPFYLAQEYDVYYETDYVFNI
jgi:NADH-quinone oxidoreductase subunit H